MNANQLLKYRHAAAAAIIGFSAVSMAHAEPATGTPKAVELAGYQVPPSGYQCLPMFHGKYTGWRCEHQSAEATGTTIAKTP